MNFLDLIKSTGYITVSKELAREIGLNETVILAELISEYEYFKEKGELDKENYFYCTIDKLEKHTTLTRETQDKAIKNLIDLDLIKKEVKGLPPKRHFKINEKEIIKLFFNKKSAINTDMGKIVSKTQFNLCQKHKQYNKHNNIKIEEEEGGKIPDKIKQKYKQIFQRELTAEMYNKILVLYSDKKIILKALEVAEENADKPSYLLKLLQDWKNNNLTSIAEIEEYLQERQAKKEVNKSKKQSTAQKNIKDKSMEELYESGYR